MTKNRFAAFILFMFVGGIFALASTGYSDNDSSSDDSSDKKRRRSGLTFSSKMTGAQEVPGVDTRGVGRVEARFDEGFTKVHVKMRLRNLEGTPFGAHFHCAVAGDNGTIALGLVSPGPCSIDGQGRLSCILTNDDFALNTCDPLVNNIVSLALAMRDGRIYTNVHTDAFPPGEVRGQMLEE